MVPEGLSIANISAESIGAPMAGHVHHLEQRRASRRRAGEEASSERMPAEQSSIVPSFLGMALHEQPDGMRGQPFRQHPAALDDAPKDRPVGDLSVRQPSFGRRDGAGPMAAHNSDYLSRSFLIGLGPTDGRSKPLLP